MVMPRSRSMSIESRIWSRNSRNSTAPHRWISRSARVDLPWSMWAMMQKLRIGSKTLPRSAGARQRRSAYGGAPQNAMSGISAGISAGSAQRVLAGVQVVVARLRQADPVLVRAQQSVGDQRLHRALELHPGGDVLEGRDGVMG